jgi:hypothetical protein
LGCNILVHGSNARNLSVQLSLYQLAKCYVFLIIAYVYCSTKLEIRAEQVLLGSEEGWGRQRGWRIRGRNGPKIYAHMNK